MHHEYELSIITVNYNGLEDTCALIDTIPFDEFSLEVIVVDNGSEANEADAIAFRYPRVKTIRSDKNLGFAGGNNLGIKAARGRLLYFLNNDTLLYTGEKKGIRGEELFRPLIERINYRPEIGMVCPKIRFAWDDCPIQFAGYTPLSKITIRNHAIGFGEKDHGQYDTPHSTPYAHGAAMMVKREAIEKAGLMPECYFLYYEEYDWSIAIRRCGYEIWYEPASTVYHKESKSTGRMSPLKTFYITRNRLLLVKRNVKETIKYISYCYLIGVVGLRDIIKYLITGHLSLIGATTRGIYNFIKF